MNNRLIECDDRKLVAILRTDGDAEEQAALAAHVETCAHCQTRLQELAASNDDWSSARNVLAWAAEAEASADSELGQSRIPCFSRWVDRHVEWNESMVRQLLEPPSHPEMLGRLGRYEIERLVGSGGMGIVFKAYDSELNRAVAIKLLAPYLAGAGSARRRFAQEARSAAGVVNDHVVPIYNVESDSEPPFLVMQYVAGGSLQEKLDCDGPLEVSEILRIGMQTAKGLAAAHAQGLIHRDVKPSNILLDEGVERALLTDFGLARTEDDACLTRSGFHPGTPHYMSPEQVRGESIDGRSDLFSLGCVLYALCTGRPPFRADSSYAVLRRITDDIPRPIREVNPEIPDWLEQLVLKLLEKDREQRFSSAEEVAETLSQWLAHMQQPNVVPAPATLKRGTSNHAGSKRGLMKYLIGAAASLLLLFAGILIVLETGKGTIRIESEVDDVLIRITQGGEVVESFAVTKAGKTLRIAAGKYRVEVEGEIDGVDVKDGAITLSRRGEKVVRILQSSNLTTESEYSRDENALPIVHDTEGESDTTSPPTTDGGTTRPAVQRRLWHKPEAVEQGGFGGVPFNNYAVPRNADLEHVVESANFIVRAATHERAAAFSAAAEAHLARLMDQWLETVEELPPYWTSRCELIVRIASDLSIAGEAGSGSAQIHLSCPREQLESVQSRELAEQIMGLILSAYFEGKTPYWAESGLLNMLRDEAEQKEIMEQAEAHRREGTLLPLHALLTLTKLPDDPAKMLVPYRQSLSLLNFLKVRGGQTRLFPFLRDGQRDGDWERALKTHYGFNRLKECEATWLD